MGSPDFDPARAAERSELRDALRHARDSLPVFLYRARQALRECLQRKGMTA